MLLLQSICESLRPLIVIRVLIIDDHPIVRTGIRSLLARAPDIEVAGEAADGEEGLRRAAETRPDVVVLDVSLPGTSGLEVLKSLKKQLPAAAVLMLSMHPEEQYAVRLLRAGASGYLSKEAPAETLIGVVRKVASGGKFVSPQVAERLAFNLDPDFEGPLHEKLSRREFEVLRLLASGKTASDIARELKLSIKTVSTYRRRILDKMSMSTTAQLIRYAFENRLVEGGAGSACRKNIPTSA